MMNRRGFTLLELLVSISLAALLMVAVMNVLAGLSTATKAMAGAHAPNPTAAAFIDLLRRDLANSDQIVVSQDDQDPAITLVGHAGLDPLTLAPTHRPVRVRYFLQQAANQRLLLREQQRQDDTRNFRPDRQLVLSGVAALQADFIEPAGQDDVPTKPEAQPTTPQDDTLPKRSQLPPPSQMIVTLSWTDTTQPDVEITLLVHQPHQLD